MPTVFSRIMGFFSTDMGIDLGTCNTLVCVKDHGIILSEPSVVAVRRGTNKVLLNGMAVGNVAKEMIGRTPGNIVAVRPLKDGVIADFDMTEVMIKYFIQKVHNRKWGIRPRVAISVPTGSTPVEKRAVTSSAERAGARRVYLVDEPIAAGIGVGLPIQEPIGSLIVDVGGGTTEVAVLSLGGIVASRSIRVAGDEMDEAIISHIRRVHNLHIGEQTAEKVKIQVGSAFPLDEELEIDVKGRDIVAQLPKKITVTSGEIREALKEPIGQIIQIIRDTLENTPPEVAGDLVDQGITMCGGGSLLRGLDKAIAKEIQIPVRIADDPMTAVAKGTYVILEHLDTLQECLESSEDQY